MTDIDRDEIIMSLSEIADQPTEDGTVDGVSQQAIKGALELLKEQVPQNGGWISVKDRMPEFGKIVLFTGLSSFGTRFITQRGWFDGTFWRRGMGKTVYPNTPVTHWMPLPEPPEETK